MTRFGQIESSGLGANPAPVARAEAAPGEERPFSEIRKNLQDGLRMLSLHRWAFFVPFSIVTSSAFLLSLYYPRTYSASTTFERRNDPIMVNLPVTSGAASFKYFRSTMARDLTSLSYMVDVVDNLGLMKGLPRNEDGTLTPQSTRRRNGLASSLGSRIRVVATSPNDHVDIVTITYTGPDPNIGAKLLDEVKRTYIRRTMAWIHQFLASQRDYYLTEQEEAGTALKLVERERTRLQLESPYTSHRDPSSISTKLAQLRIEQNELKRRRRDYQQELSATQQLIAGLDSQAMAPRELPAGEGPVAPQPEFLPVSPATARLGEQIREIDRKVAQLRRTRGMTDEHPEIKELRLTRSELSAAYASQSARDRESALTDGSHPIAMPGDSVASVVAAQPWNGERARLAVQRDAQESKIRDIEISLESNQLAMAEMTKAKDQVYDKQEVFEDVEAELAKARKRTTFAAGTLSRIEPAIRAIEQDRLLSFSEGQPARGSKIPINPRATTIILLALLAGVIAGAVFVILSEVLDHVYRSSGQVARSLGLPILDTIDVIVTAQDRRRLLVQRSVLVPLLVGACLALTGVTGSLAYFSIQRPWTFQRIMSLPEAAIKRIAGGEGGQAVAATTDIS